MVFKVLLTSALSIVLVVATFRTLFLFKPPLDPLACSETPGHKRINLTPEILDRFKGALNIPTISYGPHQYEPEQLTRLISFIETSYPFIHKSPFITRELVSNYTLLYTISGTNKHLKPFLLTSHLDVVPTVNEKWSSHPFNATQRDDGYIYARGTIDAKHLLMSMLEALETLLQRGHKPNRGFFLVFGHDEEVGGVEGAQTISKLLPSRLSAGNWDKLEYILDEGNIISRSPVPGLSSQVALVGVAEKGYVTVKVTTTGAVGHGSMPSYMTAVSKLCKAIGKFHSNLMPSKFGQGVEREMIEIFAKHASWPYKFVYANLLLFKHILEYAFTSNPTMNSLIRTSTAVTMISGGSKENVLPDSASARINHRVHQLQSVAEIVDFDTTIISDPSITVEPVGHRAEPTPTAPYCDECDAYQLLKISILQVYPKTIVVPSVFLAASDSKWYVNLTDAIYKFSAIAVHLDEMSRFHGHDERISLENYENLLNFYHHLLLNSDRENLASLRPKQRIEL